MHVEIAVDPGPPPSGMVTVDGGPASRFAGWLGLLHLLSRALEPEPTPDQAAVGIADPATPIKEMCDGESGHGKPGPAVPVGE